MTADDTLGTGSDAPDQHAQQDAVAEVVDPAPVTTIAPDTKDWAWVLQRSCPQCGMDAGSLTAAQVPDLLRDNARDWLEVLARDDVAARRDAGTWSPLEYACHVRDVHLVFDRRLALILEQDDPTFASWDQDAAAVQGGYADQVPREVGVQLQEAAERVADRYAGAPDDQWSRTGRRSDGAVFTVTTLAQYQAHEAVHHLWDVQD
jgi:hypothetical protein